MVFNPQGKPIGYIRLPERCANLCSADPSATGCTWRVAIRCTRCTSRRTARSSRAAGGTRDTIRRVPSTATPSDTLRLFVALWPDAGAHAWLRACDAAIAWPAAAARAGPERWHMTLHFLGPVPRARLPGLLPALQQPFDPFGFELGRVEAWPRGLVVVEPAHAAPALQDLQAALGAGLATSWPARRSPARSGRTSRWRGAPRARRWRHRHRPSAGRCRPMRWWPRPAAAIATSRCIRGGVLSAAAGPAPATTQIRPAPGPTPR